MFVGEKRKRKYSEYFDFAGMIVGRIAKAGIGKRGFNENSKFERSVSPLSLEQIGVTGTWIHLNSLLYCSGNDFY